MFEFKRKPGTCNHGGESRSVNGVELFGEIRIPEKPGSVDILSQQAQMEISERKKESRVQPVKSSGVSHGDFPAVQVQAPEEGGEYLLGPGESYYIFSVRERDRWRRVQVLQ